MTRSAGSGHGRRWRRLAARQAARERLDATTVRSVPSQSGRHSWTTDELLALVAEVAGVGSTKRYIGIYLLRHCGSLATAELVLAGLTRQYIAQLTRRGVIRRARHGGYVIADDPVDVDNNSQ